jgi:hypothetical protein
VHLFEVARFSKHSLTSVHRDRALEALREVAADLEDPAAGEGLLHSVTATEAGR